MFVFHIARYRWNGEIGIQIFDCYPYISMDSSQRCFDTFVSNFCIQGENELAIEELFYSVHSFDDLKEWNETSQSIGYKPKTEKEREFIRNHRLQYVEAFLASGVAA